MPRLRGMNDLLVSGFARRQKNLSKIIPKSLMKLCLEFYHERNVKFKCDPNCVQEFESDEREGHIHDIKNTITTQSGITNKLQAACISFIGWNCGYHKFKIKVLEMTNPNGFAIGLMHVLDMSLFDTIIDFWHVYHDKCIASYQFRIFEGDNNGLWIHHLATQSQMVYQVEGNNKKICAGDELTMMVDMRQKSKWTLQIYINDKLVSFETVKDTVNIKLIDIMYYPVINMLDVKDQRHKFEILECY